MKNLVLEYIEFYNTERIHAGIEYKTPREVYLDYLRPTQEVLFNVG
jgi:transposase InsO family protein